MVPRRTILVFLLLVLLTATAGCLGALDDGSTAEAAEVRDATLDAIDAVDSYVVEVTLDQSAGGIETHMEMTSRVDRASGQYAGEMTMAAGAESLTTETRHVDNRTYVTDPLTGDWYVYQQSIDDQHQNLAQQADLIEGAEVEHVGTDEIDGVTVDVLEASLPEDAATELLESPAVEGENMPEMGDLVVEVDAFEYTLYVGVEDDHLHGVDFSFEGTISTGGRSTAVENIGTIRFSEFGEPVDVEVPEDAEPIDEYPPDEWGADRTQGSATA